MKRPQPDIGEVLRKEFLSNTSTVRKFLKYWGTEIVDGVEVLKRRNYYYPASYRGENFEKLFKFLGYYKEVTTANFKGVDKAWLYLNKNRATDLTTTTGYPIADFITDNLNAIWWDEKDGTLPKELTLTTLIVIEDLINSPGKTTTLLSPSWPEAELISAVIANYDTLWDTCRITQQGVGVINKGSILDPVTKIKIPDEDDLSPDDPWLKVLATNVLREYGPPCTVKSVGIGLGQTSTGHWYNTYGVTIEIPYYKFSKDTLFINCLAETVAAVYSSLAASSTRYSNGFYTKSYALSMSSSDLDTDPDLITREYTQWADVAETSITHGSLWYKGRLRAGPLRYPRNYGLTFKEMNNYILPLITSDYKKKKVSTWKKVVAVVIAVVAVVLAMFTVGASLSLLTVAAGIGFVALTLSLMSLIASAAGWDDWAMACAEANKAIEPIVMVAAIINIVGATLQALATEGTKAVATEGTKAVATEGTKAAATEGTKAVALEGTKTATTEGVKAGVTSIADQSFKSLIGNAIKVISEMTFDTFIDFVQEFATDIVQDVIKGAADFSTGTISKESVKFAQGLIKAYTIPQQIKLEELQERNKDLQRENEDMVKEMVDQNNSLIKYMQIYAKPATIDQSLYAATYDLPYEHSQTPMHTGNVQRTTVQAVRKFDYKNDPVNAMVFADTLIM